MDAKTAYDFVQNAKLSGIKTWLDYEPEQIPVAVYDDDAVFYRNHPNPPDERPDTLQAATAVDINGVLTATIPSDMVEAEHQLIPLVYHEAFHVYQGEGHFQRDEDVDFFRALAFYPELHGKYRAICQTETDILNNTSMSAEDKAKSIATLSQMRYDILAEKDVLAFEKNLENTEATAAYVEQKSRQALFNMMPDKVENYYGWRRQYVVGAAFCHLLDEVVDDWQQLVESGQSVTEIFIEQFGGYSVELSDELVANATAEAEAELAKLEAQIADMGQVIRIQLTGQAGRAFSPASMHSLGDGRQLHPDFLMVMLPQGQINIQGIALDDIVKQEVVFPAVPFEFSEGNLTADTNTVKINLSGVEQVGKGVFKL